MAATIETMCMIFVAVYLTGSIIHRYYLAMALEKTKIELITLKTKLQTNKEKEVISDDYVGYSPEDKGDENQP